MERSAVIERLRRVEDDLRRRGVAALYLFGSVARDAASPESDIDLFFDSTEGSRLSLLDVVGIRHFLEGVLGAPIDVMTRSSLHPLLRADIEADAVSVFS